MDEVVNTDPRFSWEMQVVRLYDVVWISSVADDTVLYIMVTILILKKKRKEKKNRALISPPVNFRAA